MLTVGANSYIMAAIYAMESERPDIVDLIQVFLEGKKKL